QASPLSLRAGGRGSAGAYTEKRDPTFMARPMSPLSLSLPDMNAIWPESLPPIMSSQSWDDMLRVRFGVAAAPAFTAQALSLITACQVPPWSPVMSYWMVALTPVALLGWNRLAIASKVSVTVGIADPPVWCAGSRLKREEVHATRHRENGAGDVTGALGAQESDGIGYVLRLPFRLHRDALDHPLIQRREVGVGADDTRRDDIAGDVVARALERDRLREADHAHLARRVGGLPEAPHEAGDRGHGDDPAA